MSWAPLLFQFLLFLAFSLWNFVSVQALRSGLGDICTGKVWSGVGQTVLACLLPHVALGVAGPWYLLGLPWCLLCYWPHFWIVREQMRHGARVHAREQAGIEMTQHRHGDESNCMGYVDSIGSSCRPGRRSAPPTGWSPSAGVEDKDLDFAAVVSESVMGSEVSSQGLLSQALTGFAAADKTLGNKVACLSPPCVPAAERIDEETGECSICSGALCVRPAACLLKVEPSAADQQNPQRLGMLRSCRHYFHYDCCALLHRHRVGTCPVCKAPFGGVYRLPQVSAAAGETNAEWFYLTSLGADMLAKADLDAALAAILALDHRMIDEATSQFIYPMPIEYFSVVVPEYIQSAFETQFERSAASAPNPQEPAAGPGDAADASKR